MIWYDIRITAPVKSLQLSYFNMTNCSLPTPCPCVRLQNWYIVRYRQADSFARSPLTLLVESGNDECKLHLAASPPTLMHAPVFLSSHHTLLRLVLQHGLKPELQEKQWQGHLGAVRAPILGHLHTKRPKRTHTCARVLAPGSWGPKAGVKMKTVEQDAKESRA